MKDSHCLEVLEVLDRIVYLTGFERWFEIECVVALEEILYNVEKPTKTDLHLRLQHKVVPIELKVDTRTALTKVTKGTLEQYGGSICMFLLGLTFDGKRKIPSWIDKNPDIEIVKIEEFESGRGKWILGLTMPTDYELPDLG